MQPKERRKGKKEIHKDNIESLRFYEKFSIVGSAIQVAHISLFYFLSSSFSYWNIVFLVFAVVVHVVAHQLLRYMARPLLGPSGELLEAGAEINSSFLAEYAIDSIILTTGLQGLSAISNYFWILFLLVPGYICYKLWMLIIWPWFTSGPPGVPDEKSTKKQKQKIRRVH